MLRVTVLVVGVILLIPIALIFRSGDDGRVVQTAGLPGAAAILESGAAPTTLAMATALRTTPVAVRSLTKSCRRGAAVRHWN